MGTENVAASDDDDDDAFQSDTVLPTKYYHITLPLQCEWVNDPQMKERNQIVITLGHQLKARRD